MDAASHWINDNSVFPRIVYHLLLWATFHPVHFSHMTKELWLPLQLSRLTAGLILL